MPQPTGQAARAGAGLTPADGPRDGEHSSRQPHQSGPRGTAQAAWIRTAAGGFRRRPIGWSPAFARTTRSGLNATTIEIPGAQPALPAALSVVANLILIRWCAGRVSLQTHIACRHPRPPTCAARQPVARGPLRVHFPVCCSWRSSWSAPHSSSMSRVGRLEGFSRPTISISSPPRAMAHGITSSQSVMAIASTALSSNSGSRAQSGSVDKRRRAFTCCILQPMASPARCSLRWSITSAAIGRCHL